VTPHYHKSGLVTLRDGKLLLCRKRHGTRLLILPGGRIEAGESHADCLQRELREELGSGVSLEECTYLGTYTHAAAGGGVVTVELFAGELLGDPEAGSEIAELVWFGPEDDAQALAPSIRELILPDLKARGIVRF
jgi:8-oxo-dGTP pyrophosphatase MutT (NUDIX family)